MRLRSGRIVKDQLVQTEEQKEHLSQESSSPEVTASDSSNSDEEENELSASITTMTGEQMNDPPLLIDAQIQQAVQIAIAAIKATQPAIAANLGERHRSVTGLKDAPRFNGKTDVRIWIRRYEAYGHAMGWNDTEQLDTLTVALEEAANEWLWSQERRDPEEEEVKDKLARRKAGLIRRFGQTLIGHADYTQLYALKQGIKETVDELMERMDAIERRLPEPAPEDIKKFAFISALRPQLRLRVKEIQVATLDDATDAARKHEEIFLKVYGPRKDATDIPTTQPTISRFQGPQRFSGPAPTNTGAPPNASPRPQFPRYGGQSNGANLPPRQPLGGGPPRFPMGGGPPRPPLTRPPRTTAPEMAEKDLEDLVNKFKAVKIGSAEHGEWQRWAMSTGRCYRCLRQGHIGRECPERTPIQRMAEYEEDEEESNNGYSCMEAETEEGPHGA
jgi:hypothetical protein